MTQDEARERVRKLIVTGDNRLKQGGSARYAKARETFEQALSLAESEGLADERLRRIIELRIDDTRARESEPAAEEER